MGSHLTDTFGLNKLMNEIMGAIWLHPSPLPQKADMSYGSPVFGLLFSFEVSTLQNLHFVAIWGVQDGGLDINKCLRCVSGALWSCMFSKMGLQEMLARKPNCFCVHKSEHVHALIHHSVSGPLCQVNPILSLWACCLCVFVRVAFFLMVGQGGATTTTIPPTKILPPNRPR